MELYNNQKFSSSLRQRISDPEMLDLTRRLIAIPSENPPGNQYEECAGILQQELERLGFDHVRREGACVLASAGAGRRTLYFSGHYDVVPAQTRDQFQPRVEGLNLFGRGSSDMKSGLAAMIHAAAAARDEGLLKNGRIGIVLVPDEETAGARGSRDLEARGVLCRDERVRSNPQYCPMRGDLRAHRSGNIALEPGDLRDSSCASTVVPPSRPTPADAHPPPTAKKSTSIPRSHPHCIAARRMGESPALV